MVPSFENVTEGAMAADDPMTVDERRKYLRQMQKRYRRASRKGRNQLLDEMEAVIHLHRKSLTRLMKGDLARKARSRQRGRTYGIEVVRALKVIAESFDYLCAERLQPNLVWMAEHLAAHGEFELSPGLLRQLGQISVSPARRILGNESQPGHFETDLVHHCGISASCQYVHTLQMVDVATGWSERAATLGRSYLAIQDGFRRILARLPFKVLEIHPDNDSAFFNVHLAKFWKNTAKDIQHSRSREWHKN